MSTSPAESADLFDEADLAHPLSGRRIPVLSRPHSRWQYHVAVVIGTAPTLVGAGEDPTDREADQLAAYLEYRLRYYNDGYRARMRQAHPFDVDGTVNTFIFRRDTAVDWQYNADHPGSELEPPPEAPGA